MVHWQQMTHCRSDQPLKLTAILPAKIQKTGNPLTPKRALLKNIPLLLKIKIFHLSLAT